jgi:hypothetical protein
MLASISVDEADTKTLQLMLKEVVACWPQLVNMQQARKQLIQVVGCEPPDDADRSCCMLA